MEGRQDGGEGCWGAAATQDRAHTGTGQGTWGTEGGERKRERLAHLGGSGCALRSGNAGEGGPIVESGGTDLAAQLEV